MIVVGPRVSLLAVVDTRPFSELLVYKHAQV